MPAILNANVAVAARGGRTAIDMRASINNEQPQADTGFPAAAGDLIVAVASVAVADAIAPTGPPYVEDLPRSAYQFHEVDAADAGIRTFIWIIPANDGDQRVAVPFAAPASALSFGAWHLPGAWVEGHHQVYFDGAESGTPTVPAIEDLADGVALATVVTVGSAPGSPPDGWARVDTSRNSFAHFYSYMRVLDGSGVIAPDEFSSGDGPYLVTVLALFRIGHLIAAARGFTQGNGIPELGLPPGEGRNGPDPRDRPARPLPPEPSDVELPAEPYRLGRYRF